MNRKTFLKQNLLIGGTMAIAPVSILAQSQETQEDLFD